LEGGALVLNGLKTSSGAYGDENLTIKRNPSHLHNGKFESEESVTYHLDTSWQSEVEHFFDCISTDSSVKHGNSADALKLMELIDQTYKSNRSCEASKLGI
jgi:predicted dehydrogenase